MSRNLGSAYIDAVASGDTPVGIVGAYQNEINAIVPGAAQTAAETKGPYETTIDALFRVANQYATTMQQRRMLEAQYQQAQRGQPPMPVAGGSFALSPTMKIMGAVALAGLAYYVIRQRRR